ncbi:MAG: FG-GAP repeat protein [Chlorogloea purpurea SAG 13.99]|jgi:uncharacterized repeat protein (TIGR02059 family)|nr:FG-GAP repeat protein [Chlorogloea purpurea SAG 13.99]
MSINLSGKLSAITTDVNGTSHVVWVEGGNIQHAVYDPNSGTWNEARTIAEIGTESVKSLNLIANDRLILESNSTATTPGLAIVYQQGTNNDSDFYYTAARYDNNGDLQWLATPQALSADNVADLEPRAITYNNNGTTEVVAIGQKADVKKADNQEIREDTDLYSQNFSISSSQFTTPTVTNPAAPYSPRTSIDGVVRGNYLTFATPVPAANYSPLSRSEILAASSSFNGWGTNWSISQSFDTDMSDVVSAFKGDDDDDDNVPALLLKPIFNKIIISGSLQASEGNNPNFSLFGGGVDTSGLQLNAAAGITYNTSLRYRRLLQSAPAFSVTGTAATLYTFANDPANNYPLTVETGSIGVTLGAKFPIFLDPPLIAVDALGSAGFTTQWQLSPVNPDQFVAPLKPVLSPTTTSGQVGLGLAIGIPPVGSLAAIGVAVLSDIVEVTDAIIGTVNPDSGQALNLESVLYGIPVSMGVEGTAKIPLLAKATLSGQLFADGTIGEVQDQFDGTITLGFSVNLSVKFLGYLSASVGIFPTWTWGVEPTTTSVATADVSVTTAGVSGSLLTISFPTGLNTAINPTPAQFTVTVTDSKGNTVNVPVFGAIVQNSSVILRLEGPIPYSTLNGASDSNIKVSYTPDADQADNLQDSGGNSIAGFSDLAVTNNTPQTFVYTYNPVGGTGDNYSSGNSKQVIQNIAQDLAQDSPPGLAPTNNGQILLAWSSDAPPLTPISALVSGEQILLTFVENLNPGSTPAPSQFTVNANGSNPAVTNVDINNNSIVLNIEGAIDPGVNVSVSYGLDPDDYSNNLYLTDVTNTKLWIPAFADLAVSNPGNSDTAPVNLAAAGLSNLLTLTFDRFLENNNIPDPSQFQVIVNNNPVNVTNVQVSINSVVLSLSETINQGDVISVKYSINPNDAIKNLQSNSGQIVNNFTNNGVITTPMNSNTVIKTAFSPFGDSGISSISSIIGTTGLNSDAVAVQDSKTGKNVVAWVNTDSSSVTGLNIPGQNYSADDATQINNSVAASDIYYSVLGADNQWSIAAPLASLSGQDTNVTLGTGPNGDLMAVWLNTTLGENNATTTGIKWSSWNGNTWTTPSLLLPGAAPDAFSELTISSLNGQPAVFWTESQPVSYRDSVLDTDPVLYLRLGETDGTTAQNIGNLQGSANGVYSGAYTLGQTGALDDNGSGDPDPAALFNGGNVTLDQPIPVSSTGFSVEAWFKIPSAPGGDVNLITLSGVFTLGLFLNSGNTEIFWELNNSNFSQLNSGPGSVQNNTWYHVVGTYDARREVLSLYLDGQPIGTLNNVSFSNIPAQGNLTLAWHSGFSLYLDEVAVYNSVLSYNDVNSTDLTTDNFQNLTSTELLNILTGTDQIGNHYNARYVDPLPPETNTHYSIWDADSNSWKTGSQIQPEPQVIPTQLANANRPAADIVSATAATVNGNIAPNGNDDAVFQITLNNQQTKIITSITVTANGKTWTLGGDSGNQLGVVLGNTLLNSLNPSASGFSHTVLGSAETLTLYVDTGNTTPPSNATITVNFQGGTSQVSNNQNPVPISSEPLTLGNTTVLGTAIVTEANDASLSLIDSGFIIDTDNPVIGSVIASGFKQGNLFYVAVGNRGYTDINGNPVQGGTVSVLFKGKATLDNGATSPLTTTDLSGNPGGVLITGLTDAGEAKNNLAVSLATGDIDGDGIDDLVIGDANANNNNGAIYVILGSYLNSVGTSGATIDVNSLTSAQGFRVNGGDAGGFAGVSVAVGNFNGNSKADIVFGAPGTGSGSGKVYTLYDGNQTPTPIYTGGANNAAGYALGVSRRETNGAVTFTGSTVSDDLIIGAPGYQVTITNQWTNKSGLPQQNQSNFPDTSTVAAGAVYVFGSNTGGISSNPFAIYTGPDTVDSNGVAVNYLAGTQIASGDADGDGFQDLAITVGGINSNTGSVYVLKGKKNSNPTPQALNTVSDLVINGGLPGGQAGSVLAFPGDLNSDRYEDFLITAPQGANATGQSYVIFGGSSFFSDNTLDLNVTANDTKTTFLLNGSAPFQLSGAAATGVGDVNGDEVDDLMLTAPVAQQIYTVYGHPWLADDGSIKLSDISSDNGFVIDGNSLSLPGSGDQVLLGDINGDGFSDVLTGGNSTGVGLVFGASTKDLLDAASGTDDIIFKTSTSASVVRVVSLGDFNGDGLADFGIVTSDNYLYPIFGNNGLGQQRGTVQLSQNKSTIANAFSIGDYNGDGYDDVVLVNNVNNAYLHLGNQQGSLDTGSYLSNLSSSPSMGGVDSNGDGYSDIIAGQPGANNNNGAVAIALGNSQGLENSLVTLNPLNYNPSQNINTNNWSATSITNETTGQASSFVALDGWLYQAYLGGTSYSDGNVFIQRSRDGVNWSDISQVPLVDINNNSFTGYYNPSLTVFNGVLYLGIRDSRGNVYIADNSSQNTTSSNPLGLKFEFCDIQQDSSTAPVLVPYNNELYIFFTDGIASNGDYIKYVSSDEPYNQASSYWSDRTVSNVGGSSDKQYTLSGVTATTLGSNLYVGFQSGDVFDTNLIVSKLDNGSWTQSPKIDVDNLDGNAPSLTSVDDTLYLFYLDGDRNIHYQTSSDGSSWLTNAYSPLSGQTAYYLSATFFNQSLIVGYMPTYTTSQSEYGQLFYTFSPPLYQLNSAAGLGQVVRSTGDFNGDGIEDIAVLAADFRYLQGFNIGDTQNNPSNSQGLVAIYYGSKNGVVASAVPNVVFSSPSLVKNNFQLTQISLGGDINGDGFDDLLISSPNTTLIGSANPSANGNQGIICTVLGGTNWGNTYQINNPFNLTNLKNNQENSANANGFTITGLPNSQAGVSIDGGGDVNGDGFGDFVIGAPGNNDSLSFVVFGSDFTEKINQTGTIGDDVMLGSPTGESFVADAGDDRIYSNGGIDTVYAGTGDDLVTVSDTYFRRLDGGAGNDTLQLGGYNGQSWDVTGLSPGLRLRDFEVLDIRNYGVNILSLNALSVVNLTSVNTLTILMDENDRLNLSADFRADGTVYTNGEKFSQFTSSNSAAKILVNQLSPGVSFTTPSINNAEPLNLAASETVAAAVETTVNLDDNLDGPTRLFVSNPNVSEAHGVVNFTIQRNGNINKYTLVGYTSQDGSAKGGDNYSPVAGRILFLPGEKQKTISVKIADDGVYRGNKNFGLLVSLLKEGSTTEGMEPLFNVEANANGEQIRRWQNTIAPDANSLLNTAWQFDTSTTEGEAKVDIAIDNVGDYNSFSSYNSELNSYDEFMFDGTTGAKFSTKNDTRTGISLSLKDSARGDTDNTTNGVVRANGYLSRTIPGLITNNNQTFWAPSSGDRQIQWRLIGAPPSNYELGWIPVDDYKGTINGLNPGDEAYNVQALSRKQPIFTDRMGASDKSLTREIARDSFIDPEDLINTEWEFFGDFATSNLETNRYYMLYSTRDGQTQLSTINPAGIISESRGYHGLSFNGITAEIGSSVIVVPGSLNQPVPVSASLSRAALYNNLIALYGVDDLTGGLDTDGDGLIDLKPGDTGYSNAALARAKDPVKGVILSTPENFSTTKQTVNLLGNNIYGVVLIPNATIDDVLNNPQNIADIDKPHALFSFGAANPDNISHMARLGANLFGFEDKLGGGDRDYNDMILSLDNFL